MIGPDFLIIGAQKSGTTNLWHTLNQHPNIVMHRRKELHYFLRHTGYPDHSWYRNEFSQDIDKLTGEATPSYCFWPSALDRIHEFDRTLKLVMILRDPVRRAVSQYWMELHGGHEELPIEKALVPLEERESTSYSRGMQHSLYHHSYLWRGLYYTQLNRIHHLFPKDQVHVLRLEDFIADPHALMKQLANFLEVDPYWSFDPDHARRQGDYDPPPPVVMDRLVRFYREPNKLLMDYYNIETGDWL